MTCQSLDDVGASSCIDTCEIKFRLVRLGEALWSGWRKIFQPHLRWQSDKVTIHLVGLVGANIGGKNSLAAFFRVSLVLQFVFVSLGRSGL